MFISHSLLDPKPRHRHSRLRLSARVERLENLLRRHILYRVAHACHTKKGVAILVQLKVVSNDIVSDTAMILCPRRLDKSGFGVIRATAVGEGASCALRYPKGEHDLRKMSGLF